MTDRVLDGGMLQACEALAAPRGSEFEILYRYLRGASGERLLASEALFRSLRDIPHTVSDPAVGVANLAWWQKELAATQREGSQHPVVQALVATGSIVITDTEEFNAYLHALLVQLQDEPLSNMDELRRSLDKTAGNEARMLVAGSAQDERSAVAAGSAARLMELMKSLAGPAGDHRWLPLDLCARHGYRSERDGPDGTLDRVLRDLAELALDWRRNAPVVLRDCTTPGAGFVALRDALVGRRLAHARRRPANAIADFRAPSPGEAVLAWRTARRIPMLAGAER
jgi:phytoene/squalene synthetase